MKIKIYARVSTDDKEQDPARQLDSCRKYAEIHGHQILAEIVEHFTGDSDPFTRPHGNQLLERPLPEGIVFFSMDRFTRQHPTKVIRMLAELKDRGVKCVSITEPAFNMEGDFADLIIYQIQWFNNYFLKKLKRDIKSGMDQARKDGKHIGRPKLKFNQYRAFNILFKENFSLQEAADDLGVSKSAMHRFKRDVQKNPDLYKKLGGVPKPGAFGTDQDLK